MELYELTIHKAAELIEKKEITSVELTEAMLSRIKKIDEKIGAYITVETESAIERAKEADKEIAAGNIKPLTGIPIGLKDLICTKGIKTTCGSKILDNFIPPYDATVMLKLKEAGAVILGKTNMDEFAMGSTTENSGILLTKNPWDLSRIPGGSSGGSAAAVAADMCCGCLGSDTGGSIRQPASHCGVVGLKPTYGRVSRYGLVAFASSLDQIGPIAKDVEDSAILLNVISGYDPKDSTSVAGDVPDFKSFLKTDGLADIKVGVPMQYMDSEGIDQEVIREIKKGIETLKSLGAEVVEISLPHTKHAVAAYYVIAPSEASSNLARYDAVKYGLREAGDKGLIDMFEKTRSKGFGPEVQRRIIIGTYCLSSGYYDAYYKKASQVRTLIIEDFKKAFEKCDIIASPAAPTPALKIGEVSDDPLAMYMSDVFTLSANLAGIPGISVPCGFSSQGMPIGLQLMGPHFKESKILRAAINFEKAALINAKPKL